MACLKSFHAYQYQQLVFIPVSRQKFLSIQNFFVKVPSMCKYFHCFKYTSQKLSRPTCTSIWNTKDQWARACYHSSFTTPVSQRLCLQHNSHIVSYKENSSIVTYHRKYSTMDSHGSLKEDTLNIFNAAVNSVLPRQMINKSLQYDSNSNILEVQGNKLTLNHNVYIVGFGKAVLGMARAVEDLLHDHLAEGIVSVPVGTQQCFREAGKSDLLLSEGSKVRVNEGASNNLPDLASHKAAQSIHQLVSKLEQEHLLIVLISGGGSALLPLPHSPITLEEETAFTRMLSSGGATIHELNTIRKNIEVLKGGGLAQFAYPAKVLSLILPDVIGDDLDIIASGPTVMDPSTTEQCLSLIEKFGLSEKTPASILNFLKSKYAITTNISLNQHSKSPSSEKELFENVLNIVVGSNKIAVRSASEKANHIGYLPVILTTAQEGNAADVGVMFATLARFVCLLMRNKTGDKSSRLLSETELTLVGQGLSKDCLNSISRNVHKAGTLVKGFCLIAGGETTVKVKGTGIGGRNQEMALACAIALNHQLVECEVMQEFQVQFLSAGTDGIDGPTDAAGAIVSPEFCDIAQKEGLDAGSFLDNNDSYTIFSKINSGLNQVAIGHTGTNVMDLQILVVKPK